MTATPEATPDEDSESAVPSSPSPTTPPTTTPAQPRQPRKTPLYEAMHAARYARQSLIKEIEDTSGATLLCYVSAHRQIDRTDTVAMVDLLHNVAPATPIDLLLHSPGGDIDASEKLITLIRNRAGTATVRVIVPDYAKSAATLIALGANAIVMSDSSELGVIDPQVELPDTNGNVQTLSAQSYLDAFHLHADNLRKDPGDPVAQLMLAKMEPATVRKLERITKRSRSIAAALLNQAMIKDHDDAKEVADELSNTQRWHSHGQMISFQAATGLGLNVTYLEPDAPLWEKYWRLYCLQLWATEGNAKLFESSWASLPIT
ncbi:MAG: ATP-dependent Clp protease proteolytic subunit [Actinomycetales bacterium]|nr:ATP-dependent Clp protease proteolytic subunit [Actinomycetales bacterium]